MIVTFGFVSLIALNSPCPALSGTLTAAATASVSEATICLGDLDAQIVIQSLDRIGFSASALAAAGVTTEEAGGVAVALATALAADPTELDRLDEEVGSLRATVEAARRPVRAGIADSADLAALAAQSALLAAAESNRTNRLHDLRTVASANLSANAIEKLGAVIGQGALWASVPEPYRLTDRPEPVMLRLREALTCERLALEDDLDLDEETAALLSAVRQEPGVALSLTTWVGTAAVIEGGWQSGLIQGGG
jgi:hypothetical protein